MSKRTYTHRQKEGERKPRKFPERIWEIKEIDENTSCLFLSGEELLRGKKNYIKRAFDSEVSRDRTNARRVARVKEERRAKREKSKRISQEVGEI